MAIKKVTKKATKRASALGTGRVASDARKSVTMPQWSTACPDWRKRIVARETLTPCEPLFPDSAQLGWETYAELQMVDQGSAGDYPTFGELTQPWTREFVEAIFGSYDQETGKRLMKEFFMLISKKNGKALALDTPIPTPSGWTTMGELQPGDQVYGVDGKPCNVIATSEIFTDHKCYRLGFSNGEHVVADAGHLWATSALADNPGAGRGNGGDLSQRKVRVRTTEEIAATLLRPHDGARNHSMPMPSPIRGRRTNLPVSPYALGAWLGDGHTMSGRITTHQDDGEILDAIRAEGWPVEYRSNNGSKASTYVISDGDRSQSARNKSFASALRKAGVLGDKHIPEAYFHASFEQRLSLLQGLMDTDGTISKAGTALSYTGKNERLVRDVGRLLSTMGVKYSLIEKSVTCNGEPCGTAFTLQFCAFRDELPAFKLSRKLERMHLTAKPSSRSKTIHITSAVEVPTVPTKCICVDSPDHQFLFGETMLPTHNSTLAAGIMLTALILNWRDEAEFIILSPTKEVADNSFKVISAAINADEQLRAIFQVQTHIRTITHRVNKATLKVVASDSQTVSGKKAVGILVDELHEFGKVAKADQMLTEATGGLMSRPEGFVIYLTTQSSEPPAGVFKDKLGYARKVRDGKVEDNQFYPIIYEFPSKMITAKLHLLPENFYVTNPNMGSSVDEDYLNFKINQAKETSEKAVIDILAKHLNVEVGMNLADDNWPGAPHWVRQGKMPEVTLPWLLANSEVVTVGLDGGGLDDLFGMCVLGRLCEPVEVFVPAKKDPVTGHIVPAHHAMVKPWVSWEFAYATEVVLKRRQEIAPRLRDFEADGDLMISEDLGEDILHAAQTVASIYNSGLLYGVGIDPDKEGAVLDHLVSAGVPEELCKKVSQGARLAGPILTTERKLAENVLRHRGRPMMAWSVGNAKIQATGNAIRVTKQASGTAKIDPLIAVFNAVALMELNPPAQTGDFDFEEDMRMAG